MNLLPEFTIYEHDYNYATRKYFGEFSDKKCGWTVTVQKCRSTGLWDVSLIGHPAHKIERYAGFMCEHDAYKKGCERRDTKI